MAYSSLASRQEKDASGAQSNARLIRRCSNPAPRSSGCGFSIVNHGVLTQMAESISRDLQSPPQVQLECAPPIALCCPHPPIFFLAPDASWGCVHPDISKYTLLARCCCQGTAWSGTPKRTSPVEKLANNWQKPAAGGGKWYAVLDLPEVA